MGSMNSLYIGNLAVYLSHVNNTQIHIGNNNASLLASGFTFCSYFKQVYVNL